MPCLITKGRGLLVDPTNRLFRDLNKLAVEPHDIAIAKPDASWDRLDLKFRLKLVLIENKL